MRHPMIVASVISSVVAVWPCYGQTAFGATLNAPQDAGAATPVPTQVPQSEAISDMAKRFPLRQSARCFVLGGGVRGFGMLAQYDTPISEIYVRRSTLPVADEPYTPITLARVFGPNGDLLAIHEFTDQPAGAQEIILKFAPAGAGIYRVSFSGGRRGDLFDIGMPRTEIWGVRGEMALGLTAASPRNAFMYLPRTVQTVIAEVYGSRDGKLAVESADGQALGTSEWQAQSKRNLLIVERPTAGSVIRVTLPASPESAVAFDGVPGLLCPSAKAAEALKGGTVEADGLLVQGPLQARIRKVMLRLAQHVDVKVSYPTAVPKDLKDPILEAQLWGKYGLLSNMDHGISNQILEPQSPWLGAVIAPEARAQVCGQDWQAFLSPVANSTFDSTGFAAAATLPAQLNAFKGDKATIHRAALATFYHLVRMQGDDLLREGTFRGASYPITHVFFTYPTSLAQSLVVLKDQLDPETRALWSQALVDAGDKIADYQAYQSNQWVHMIRGHLLTYIATGEKRFLGYFERQMLAYVNNTFGPNAKFGQHPAGYFLEEYGPDGNYDHLNSTSLISSYFDYKDLPDAKPEMVKAMHDSIERNLNFVKFYWLLQPDGDITGPRALNCRTRGNLATSSWPGLFLAQREFDLAYTRYKLSPLPEHGAGYAATLPHIANSDAYAMRVLEWAIPLQGQAFKESKNIGGNTVMESYHAFQRPLTARVVPLPYESETGTWTLPGQLVWKRAGIYALTFYDVAGSKTRLTGKTGGGPQVLWSKPTGSVVIGVRNTKPSAIVEKAEDLTHACVFGRDAKGELFWTGTGRSELTWVSPNSIAEIKTDLPQEQGSVTWRYEMDARPAKITVSYTGLKQMSGLALNLPIMASEKAASMDLTDERLVYRMPGGAMHLTWDSGKGAKLEAAEATEVKRLVIPIPADRSSITLTIMASDNQRVQE